MFLLDSMLIKLVGDATSYLGMMATAGASTQQTANIQTQATQSTQQFTSASQRMAAAHARAAQAVANGATSYRDALQDSMRAIREAENAGRSFVGMMDDMHTRSLAAGMALRELGVAFRDAFGSFVQGGLASAGRFEQNQVAFGVMLNDAREADRLLENLTKFAAETPYEMPEIQQATMGLVQFGERGDELMATLKTLGNAASATGSNFGEIALIFNQVRGVGKLLTQDFRQLSTRGIISLDDIAKHYKKTREEAQDMLSSGKISFEDLRKILTGLSGDGGRFANMMEKQSKTLEGLYSTLSDNINITMRKAVQDIVPYVKSFVDMMINLTAQFDNLPQSIKSAIGLFAGLGAGLGVLVMTAGGVMMSFAAFNTILPMITAGYARLTASIFSAAAAQNLLNVSMIAGKAALLGAAAVGGVALGYWIAGRQAIADYNKELEKSSKMDDQRAKLFGKRFDDKLTEAQASSSPLKAVEGVTKELEIELEGVNRGIELQKQKIEELAPAWYTAYQGGRQDWNAAKEQLESLNKDHDRYIDKLTEARELANKLKPTDVASVEDTEKAEKYIQSLEEQFQAIAMGADKWRIYEMEVQNVDKGLVQMAMNMQKAVKAAQLNETIEGMERSLDDLYSMLGAPPEDKYYSERIANERELQKLRKEGHNEAQIDAVRQLQNETIELRKQIDLREKSLSLIESLKSPGMKRLEQEAELLKMEQAGLITKTQMRDAMNKVANEYDEATGRAQLLKDTLAGDLNSQRFSADAVGLKVDLEGMQKKAMALDIRGEGSKLSPEREREIGILERMAGALESMESKDPIKVNEISTLA